MVRQWQKAATEALTLIEEDAQMPPLRQAEALDKTRVFILEPLPHRRQLLLGELPVFPLSRLPVVGSHAGVRIDTGSRHEGRSLVVINGEAGTWDLDHLVEDANSGLASAVPSTQARRRLVGSVSATGWSASWGYQGSDVDKSILPCMLSILVSAQFG